MKSLPKIFSQRDSQWASQRLGTVNGTTIGQYGCFVTSFAMVAQFYGKDVNPAQLDDLFTNNGLYANGNLCTDDGLHKAYGDIEYVSSIAYPNDPADLNKLKDLLSDPSQIVILELDFDHDPNDGIQTHFVVAVECDGSNVTIADPWYGTQNNFSDHYGNNPSQTIQKFVVYKGAPPSPMATITQKELDDIRLARDKNYNDYQDALKSINTLNSKIEELGQTIQKDARDDHDLGLQILNLNQQITDIVKALGLSQGSSQQAILDAIVNLKKPHDEVVKQVVPVMDKLAAAAIFKRAPKKTKTLLDTLKDFFNQFRG